jgi:GNAT superfamily N-acetyltransferase
VVVSEPFRLAPADVAQALPLSGEAGWNQTADDWRIFISHGATFGIRADHSIVATAAALPYQGAFGFVGMVLTTATWRHRGFATRLLALAVQVLRETGRIPVLDASPEGRPVYQKQGFVPIDTLQRWSGLAVGRAGAATAEADAIATLDAVAFGASRRFLFDDMLARDGSTAIAEPGGCVMARRGLRASHVGPLVAAGETQALGLLHRMLASLNGPVVLDVPVRWRGLSDFLTGRGFARERPFTRMALERAAPFGDPARLFAVTGPEFG